MDDFNALNLGLDSLLLDDSFSGLNSGWDNGFSLGIPSEDVLGFDSTFVPLPFLGGQLPALTPFDDVKFGPELAPRFLRDYRTYPIDPKYDAQKRRQNRKQKYATYGEGESYRERRQHRSHRYVRRSGEVTPRADGPGYYDSADYDNDRSPLPTPQDQSVNSSNNVPPPPAPPPPPPLVSSSTQSSSQQGVLAPGGPPVADDVGSNSSHSSDSSSSDSESSSSSDTTVDREPVRSKDRGRSKAKKRDERRLHSKHRKQRRRTPDDFYRVERARGISPNRNPPTYEEYRRFYQRQRSSSPESSISSVSSTSSSVDSSRFRGFQIKKRKLYKAASKCTADYLTRLKLVAPHRHTTPPWVKNIADMFYRIGFTVVDAVFEDYEGIVTILAPPELVAREIEHLPEDVQRAITSIRSARVCRKNGGYDLQVW